MPDIVASQARSTYDSNNGSTIRDRAASSAGDAVNSNANLILGYFFHPAIKVNYRSFLNFDLSGESGTVSAVSLTITRNNSGDFPDHFVLASEAGDDLATSDYQDGIVGATGYPFTDDATKFTDSAETLSDGGGDGDTITIDLNAAAVSHANAVIGTSDRFKCALVNTHDFNDTYDADDDGFSTALAVQGIGAYSGDEGDSSKHPVLNVTTEDSVTTGPFKIGAGASVRISSGKFTIK